jgi:hypothetical protein
VTLAPDPPDQVPEAFRTAILTAVPALAEARFAILGQGWHSTAVLAGPDHVFKFPRSAAAEAAIRREAALLQVIRPRVRMAVPDMVLHPGPPVMTEHRLLAGEQVLTRDYLLLDAVARERLARDMAQFHADLHRIPIDLMTASGAEQIGAWPAVAEVRRLALPALSDDLRHQASTIIDRFAALPPDPLGLTYGFFDGHGWNMAFDHQPGRLNGIFDFGDSGIGPLHQEFIYSSLIDIDLTWRIIAAYEDETGCTVDRGRVATLIGMHRLVELAESADDPEALPARLGAAESVLKAHVH